MIVTVTPAPALDRTYVLPFLHRHAVNRAAGGTVEASGKGVNVSFALRHAGVATIAVLPLGGPEGRHLADLLGTLPHRPVEVRAATRTNITVVESAEGATTKLNAAAPALSAAETAALVGAVAALARRGSWVAVCGTVPDPPGPALIARLVEAAREAGAWSVADTSGPGLVAAVDAGADVVAPNADELAELAGRPCGSVAEAARRARDVARSGPGLVVSLGNAGALWVRGDRALHASPLVVPVVNTVGAGDALLAGWLAGGEPPDVDVAGDTARLARAVAWGTAAVGFATTTGDVAAAARPDLVTVRLLDSD